MAVAFEELSQALQRAQYPLPLDGSQELRTSAQSLRSQLQDYLLPRANRLDAPLLAVVGGSTGAGKSTVVNSLMRAPVTQPGVLRPTTKSPVLICHPQDLEWFRSGKVLPGLTRSDTPVHDSRAIQVVPLESLPLGLAVVDAPDIDSIDDENRQLSRQLLAAADLWLFVTSAARYADAVGWEILDEAARREVLIALILNRCPPEAMADLTAHLGQMLDQRGLRAARLFALPEFDLTHEEFMPVGAIQPIRQWLASLAAEGQNRADIAIQSLAGATRALDPQVRELATGLSRQAQALESMRHQAESHFQRAALVISQSTSDGTMLRGEVLSRWQDVVGTGEFMRGVQQQISAWRDRISTWITGETKVEEVQVAIHDGLAALIIDRAGAATQATVDDWSVTGWGSQIVAANPDLRRLDPSFMPEVEQLIREWQAAVLGLVEEQGANKRFRARLLALGTNAIGVALIIVVFASTGGLTTAEVGIAGGTSLVAQRLLESVFGEDAVRKLAEQAKQDLDARVDALLATQLARFEKVVDTFDVHPQDAQRLHHAADQLQGAASSAFADLTRPEGY